MLLTADWTVTEFSGAVLLKARAQQLTTRQAKAVLEAFNDFADGGIRLLAVSRQAFHLAADKIQKMPGLRARDALFLCVAAEAGAEQFATLDKLLAAKAQAMGLILTEFANA